MSNFCKSFATFTMFCQATSVWLILMMLHEQRPALVWSMRQVQHCINTQMLGLDCTSAVCVCWSKWPSWGLLSNIHKDLAFFESFFLNVKPFPVIEFRYPREFIKNPCILVLVQNSWRSMSMSFVSFQISVWLILV